MRRVQALARVGDDARHSKRQEGVTSLRLVARDLAAKPRQRLADEVLHRDVVLAVRLAKVEYAADVRMGDPRSDLRLIEKHLDVLLLLGEVPMDPFQRDQLLEARRPVNPGQVHRRHPAGSQLEAELVPSDALGRGPLRRLGVVRRRQRLHRRRLRRCCLFGTR